MFESLEFRKLLSSSLSNGTLSVVGTGGADHVDVTKSGSNLVVNEHNGQAPKSYSAASVNLIKADVKDGNDVVTIAADITTPASLIGGNGADSLTGGGGNDVIGGGGSSDSVDGGNGDDTIDYSGRSSPINASLLWQENQQTFEAELRGGGGQTNVGEQDSYLSIETIRGGTGNDSLTYDVVHPIEERPTEPPRILLDGGPGNDSILGSQDPVLAVQTLATLKGGAGNDTIRYGFGAGWRLIGDEGDDTFQDYPSGDDAYPLPADGGPGFDTQIDNQRNGTDLIMGPGLERAIVSKHQHVIGNDLDNIIEVDDAVGGVEGRGGNDRITADESGTISGGSGNDIIVATQTLGVFGNDGDDDLTLVTQQFSGTTIDGGAGNDRLHGGPADDNFVGGPGNDTADFSDRGYSLNVTLNDQPDDGPRTVREHDNVHSDIEHVLGGRGNDLIVGNPAANHLVGKAGNDTICGGGGNDTLDGGTGSDQLFGQEGDDQLLAKDLTRDTVDCGPGNDSAERDAGVDVVNSVETVS